MELGQLAPATFKNVGSWNLTAAIAFQLRITVMRYLDFQRGKVPHNFHVCAAFLKTVREFCNVAL